MLSVQVCPVGVRIEGDSGELMRIAQAIISTAADSVIFGVPHESTLDDTITVRCTELTRVD